MSEPLVSIVLPVYNGARYLRESLDGVLAQTYAHWELIIVDDCSTDDTPAIVAEYQRRDARIRSLRNPANRRLPGSLNVGFAAARGEFLTWTSDDNVQRPSALRAMVDFMQVHPAVALVYADASGIDARGVIVRPEPARDAQMLAFENPIGACFLYRRAVLERLGGYDERFFLIEDYDYWVRIACQFEVRRLPVDLYLYRQHEGSLTAKRAQAIAEMRERMLARHLPAMRWLTPGDRALAWLDLACRARASRRRGAAARLLARALWTAPEIVFLKQRQYWAEAMLARLDPGMRRTHEVLLYRSVLCDEGFAVLAAYAVAGEPGARIANALLNFVRRLAGPFRSGPRRLAS